MTSSFGNANKPSGLRFLTIF